MIDFFRGKRTKGDSGSMVVALFVTIMFLVLSVGIASVVVSQIAQNRAEDTARVGQWALTSAISQAAEKIGPAARALSGVATTEPTTWTSQGINNNNAFSRWWVSSSSNAVLNPSILPTGNWSAVAYGNNVWVGINTAGVAFTSSDGVNWTQRNNLPNYTTLTYSKMTYGLGYFIAIPSTASNTVAISVDGITWNTATLPTSDTYTVACSTVTCAFLSLTATSGYYTGDVNTFTLASTLPFIPENVSFSINNFVMSGNGHIASSNDAATWTSRTISNHNWGLIGSINGLFTAFDVQATGSNIIATSSDAITWTDRTLPSSGNWVAAVTAAPQEAVFSNSISGIAQSTYLATSDGLAWVSGNLLASGAWTGASANTNGFVVYSNASASAYLIPVTSGVSSAQTLTVTARTQSGRVTGSNNAQYMASMVYNWNSSKKRWIASKYLGASSASLSATPGIPTGVSGTRTATGTIVVSWVAPVNTGSSAITSYLATASPGGYYCTNGGQLSGTTCTLTTASAATYTAAFYSCTSGDVPAGTQVSAYTCTHSTTYTSAYTAGSYTCTAGDTPSGIQTSPFTCTHTTTYTSLYAPAGYACTAGDTPAGSQSSSFTCTHQISGATYHAGSYTCTAGDTPSGTQGSAFTCTHTAVSTYTSPGIAGSYSCPGGGTLSGTTCTTTTAATPTCSNGGTFNGTSCILNLGAPTHTNWVCGASGSTTLDAGGWWTGSPNFWSPVGLNGSDFMPQGICFPLASVTTLYNAGSHTCAAASNGKTMVAVLEVNGSNAQSPGGKPATQYATNCVQATATYAATDNQYCPSGGTLSGTTCITSSGGTYGATGNTTYSCPSGGTLSGSTCTLAGSNYAATYTASYYYCTAGPYSQSTCAQVYGSWVHVLGGYSCPSGGTLSGTTCNITGSTYAATGSTIYSCPSGGTLSGSTCTLAGSSYPSSHLNYSCNSGDVLAGSTCTIPGGYWNATSNNIWCGGGTFNPYQINSTPNQLISGTCYNVLSLSGYTCSSGTLSGTNCITTVAATYTAGSYSCNAGDTPSGIQGSSFTCTNTAVSTYTSSGTASYYSCATGTLSGTNCISTYTSIGSAARYYCNSGDTPATNSASSFTCTHNAVYGSPGAPAYYSCTSGDSPSGTQIISFICTHSATYTSIKTAAYYSCFSGTLAGNVCLFNTAISGFYNSGGYTCNSISTLNCTITGMTTGSYTFTVTATNGVGTSNPSLASLGVQSTAMIIAYPSQIFSTTQFSQVLPIMVQNSSGGSMTYAETGTLPSGVTFSNASGSFTGPSSWASQVGYPFTVSVSATDAGSGVTVTTPVTFTLITP